MIQGPCSQGLKSKTEDRLTDDINMCHFADKKDDRLMIDSDIKGLVSRVSPSYGPLNKEWLGLLGEVNSTPQTC